MLSIFQITSIHPAWHVNESESNKKRSSDWSISCCLYPTVPRGSGHVLSSSKSAHPRPPPCTNQSHPNPMTTRQRSARAYRHLPSCHLCRPVGACQCILVRDIITPWCQAWGRGRSCRRACFHLITPWCPTEWGSTLTLVPLCIICHLPACRVWCHSHQGNMTEQEMACTSSSSPYRRVTEPPDRFHVRWHQTSATRLSRGAVSITRVKVSITRVKVSRHWPVDITRISGPRFTKNLTTNRRRIFMLKDRRYDYDLFLRLFVKRGPGYLFMIYYLIMIYSTYCVCENFTVTLFTISL